MQLDDGTLLDADLVVVGKFFNDFSRAREVRFVRFLQMSTGDRTILGRISERGNGYLRTLFMQAARVILLRPASWPKHGFGGWLARAAEPSIPTFWRPLSPTSWHGSPDGAGSRAQL